MKKCYLHVFVMVLCLATIGLAQNYSVYDSESSELPYNAIYSMAFDNQGNIWMGGQRDAATGVAYVSQLDLMLKSWINFEPTELALDALEDRVFYIAVDDQNTKWFCTHYGVSWLKADGTSGIVDFTQDAYTRTVQTDPYGNVYISIRADNRADSKIYVSNDHGETWQEWGLSDIGFSLGPDDARPEVYDLKLDSKGQLWICTWYGVTYRKMDGSWTSISELEGDYTYAMTIDPDDHVWVPNASSLDLYEIMPDESIVTHDSTSILPLKYAVNDLESDFWGNIWCSLNGGGLLKILPDGTYETFTNASTGGLLPEDTLFDLKIDNNVIWVATETAGVVRIDGLIPMGENTVFNSDNSGLPFNATYCIAFDRNNDIWIGGQRDAATGVANVSELDRFLADWAVYQPNELALDALEDRVFYIAVDDQNTKWFCTHYGVSWLKTDGTSGIVDFTQDAYTRTVQTDPYGNVYISIRADNRADSKIYVSNDHGETWQEWGLSDIGFSLGPDDARPEVYDLKLDSKSQMWICTWYGVTYRKMDGSWQSIEALEGDYTYAMTIDPQDHVWVPNASSLDLYEIMPDESITTHDSTTIEPLKYAVNDLESDFWGNIWCTLNGGGLLKIAPDGSYEHWTSESSGGLLPENALFDLEIKDNILWIATETAGIVRLPDLIPTETAVKKLATQTMPEHFALHKNYPNPFNPSTTIQFDLVRQADITLAIYNIRGEQVKLLAHGTTAPGRYSVVWDGSTNSGSPATSGVYFYRLSDGQTQLTGKMMLIK